MSGDSDDQAPKRARGLGSGLAALLGDSPPSSKSDATPTAARKLPIASLKPGRLQPRTLFDDDEIDSLAESIRQQGIIQPILARPAKDSDGDYEIIAGERRWRAAQRAGLHEVPVVVHFIGDQDALEIALVENLQRQDLNILEEAEAYDRLVREYGNLQEDVAKALGRSRSHITNAIRLLTLPDEVKSLISEGKLSAGHARALVGAENATAIARRIVARNLSVRQTEKLVQTGIAARPAARGGRDRDPNVRDLEDSLTRRLGLKVTISQGKRSGKLILRYKTLDQLDDIVKRLG
jgi:ParB family chromosome partitioning protein